MISGAAGIVGNQSTMAMGQAIAGGVLPPKVPRVDLTKIKLFSSLFPGSDNNMYKMSSGITNMSGDHQNQNMSIQSFSNRNNEVSTPNNV